MATSQNYQRYPSVQQIRCRSIGSNDPDDLNDFRYFNRFADENVDLEQSNVSVSSGSSLVSFEGENSVYRAVIRPPETAGTVTVSIAENAVPLKTTLP